MKTATVNVPDKADRIRLVHALEMRGLIGVRFYKYKVTRRQMVKVIVKPYSFDPWELHKELKRDFPSAELHAKLALMVQSGAYNMAHYYDR